MIRAVGIDAVEIPRMESLMNRWGGRLMERLFTAGEIAYCSDRVFPAQHYGARFAAKEACMKCLGRGIWGGLAFRDIETVRDDGGAVRLVLHGRAREILDRAGGGRLHLSMTHTNTTATALVVMDRPAGGDEP